MVCESKESKMINGFVAQRQQMKVRLEITNDDGTTANVEFKGNGWQKRLIAFIGLFSEDRFQTNDTLTASDASSLFSLKNVSYAGQYSAPLCPHMCQPLPQFVQVPVGQHFMQVSQPVCTHSQCQYHTQFNSDIYHNVSNLQQKQPVNPQQSAPNITRKYYNTKHVTRKNQSIQDMMSDNKLTISERLELFLKYEYPHVWFSSLDIQKHYEKIYGSIKLSTVSTYLSRMFNKNLLERRGNRTQREYKYISEHMNISMTDEIIHNNTSI